MANQLLMLVPKNDLLIDCSIWDRTLTLLSSSWVNSRLPLLLFIIRLLFVFITRYINGSFDRDLFFPCCYFFGARLLVTLIGQVVWTLHNQSLVSMFFLVIPSFLCNPRSNKQSHFPSDVGCMTMAATTCELQWLTYIFQDLCVLLLFLLLFSIVLVNKLFILQPILASMSAQNILKLSVTMSTQKNSRLIFSIFFSFPIFNLQISSQDPRSYTFISSPS